MLHHGDRGSQYASAAYQATPARHGIEPSISRKGDRYDNAVTESFFSSLKGEWTRRQACATRQQAVVSLLEYIEVFYNRQRLHPTLNHRSPVDFEARVAS